MKKTKRLLAMLMAAVMAMGMLAGCGGGKTGDEEVTLTWYIMGDTTLRDNNEVFQMASDMVYEDLGYRLNIKPIDMASYSDKMKMIIAGGEEWDICWTSNWCNDYAANVSNGAYLQLDDLLDEVPALKESINEKIWEGVRSNGGIYGVPVQQIMARNSAVSMPLEFWEKYNDTLVNVKDYQDMDAFMQAFGTDYPNIARVGFGWQNLMYDQNIERIANPVAIDLEGPADEIKVYNMYETEKYKELILLRREWTEKGYSRKGTDGNASTSNKKPEQEPWVIDCYKPGYETMREASVKYPVKAFTISDNYLTNDGIQATIHSINYASKHPVEALKFLEYANTTPEFVNLLVYGIEGKHYEKIDDVTVRRTDTTGYQNSDWCIANVFNTYVMEGQPADAHVQTKQMNDNAKTSRILGFNLNRDAIKVQLANCISVLNEYQAQLEEGLVENPEAVLNEMNAKLKAAGVDEVVAEVQRQIDEWLANK
ncbi:MAG: ABC transporter substrate-binding protein [Prevotella sp.]|nr:ABC transporter substrate-binding protein [Prevotella sp.]